MSDPDQGDDEWTDDPDDNAFIPDPNNPELGPLPEGLFPSHVVLELRCAKCNSIVCKRAQSVFLIADQTKQLYSTDLKTKFLSEKEGKVMRDLLCPCFAQKTTCGTCDAPMGYHVLRPCRTCSEGDNNGHYYMITGDVIAAPRIDKESGTNMVWHALQSVKTEDDEELLPIVAVHETGVEPTYSKTVEDMLHCGVCTQIMSDCVTFPMCGHSTCETCGIRQSDYFRVCPICRTPTEGRKPVPNYLARDVVGEMLIWCRYALEYENSQGGWYRPGTNASVTTPSGIKKSYCDCTVKLGCRAVHESVCPFRTH